MVKANYEIPNNFRYSVKSCCQIESCRFFCDLSIRTAEWCLPLEHLHSALTMVIKLAQDYAEKQKQYSLLPIYVRLARSDDLFLSPASKFRPDGTINDHSCYIEVRKKKTFVRITIK